MTCALTTRAILLVFLSSTAIGCAPPFYFAESIRGRVVDAETDQPLPGTVVVALWELDEFGRGTARVLKAEETVADSDGNFTLPGWGPRLRPCLTRLENHDPTIVIFRAGYERVRLMNEDRDNVWSVVRRSDWDGAAIALKPFRGTPKSRFSQLHSVAGEMSVACMDHGYTFPLLRAEMLAEDGKHVTGPDWKLLQSTIDILTSENQ